MGIILLISLCIKFLACPSLKWAQGRGQHLNSWMDPFRIGPWAGGPGHTYLEGRSVGEITWLSSHLGYTNESEDHFPSTRHRFSVSKARLIWIQDTNASDTCPEVAQTATVCWEESFIPSLTCTIRQLPMQMLLWGLISNQLRSSTYTVQIKGQVTLIISKMKS